MGDRCIQGVKPGDQGLYWTSRWGLVVLPLRERFHVWVDEEGRMQAEHEMWIWKWRFLHIHYQLIREEAAQGKP
ncbi:hypothetical protein [Laceyella tengchongensis]|uniref:hypothetical protein n=1 Tax=Laceyella tengchongensis TaxID=574699 RepID=UPI0012B85F32|nr:hypothetical protein [Laceyella tengchongensis]